MKRGHDKRLDRLLKALTPRQRTIDFGASRLWEHLPVADRRACRDAIAALLYQVITTQENEDHE
jgi:hypothetical protein